MNVETSFDLVDVREKLEHWRQDYNQVRPHSALADRTPEEFARDWQQSSAASLRTAWPAKPTPAGAVHRTSAADPKLLRLFVPPSDVKGGPEKLSQDSSEPTAKNSQLLEVSIESVECDKRRKYRHQPTTPGRDLYRRPVYFRGAAHFRQTLTYRWYTCRG